MHAKRMLIRPLIPGGLGFLGNTLAGALAGALAGVAFFEDEDVVADDEDAVSFLSLTPLTSTARPLSGCTGR